LFDVRRLRDVLYRELSLHPESQAAQQRPDPRDAVSLEL
jgi:hypothetical protein